MTNNMNYSKNGLTLTESFEGVRLAAYQDVVGIWTIGYGHTKGVYAGMVCSQAQAEQWLLEDVQECVDHINQIVTVKLTQDQFNALVDFSFNLGIGALERSTLLKMVNAGDFTDASKQFLLWDKAGGKVVEGLFKRREADETMFCEGIVNV